MTQFLLEEFPDDALDQVLSLPPKGKSIYFTRLAKQFYDFPEDSDEYDRYCRVIH